MDTNDDSGDHIAHRPAALESVDVDELRAELADARRIARWLYDRSPALRLFLGDVSEWPWLLEPQPAEKEAPNRLIEADRDSAVLRSFAVIQAAGGDPFGAEDIADTLSLSAQEFDGCLYRLIHGGLVTGGKTFSRSFVETVTDEGMAAAGMLDSAGRPLRVLPADTANFTRAGYGNVRIPARVSLTRGQTIILTSDEGDALEAKVLTVDDSTADVRVRWDR